MLTNLIHKFYHCFSYTLFDIRAPFVVWQTVHLESACLVSALFPNAALGDVRHHIIGVTSDPNPGPKFFFESQYVIQQTSPPSAIQSWSSPRFQTWTGYSANRSRNAGPVPIPDANVSPSVRHSLCLRVRWMSVDRRTAIQ